MPIGRDLKGFSMINQKIKLGLFLLLFTPACTPVQIQPETNQADTQQAWKPGWLRDDSPAAKQEDEKAKRIQAEDQYQSFLKTYKCNPGEWSRYEFGAYFQKLAFIHKISPYDLAKGADYARRNISPDMKNEIQRNYFNYTNTNIPWQIANKFYQNFPTIEAEAKNQRSIFNDLVKRDSECYKKLK